MFDGHTAHDDYNAGHKSPTFFSFSSKTACVVLKKPLNIHFMAAQRTSPGSPLITTPPRNQSMDFNVTRTIVRPISMQRGWSQDGGP